MSFGQASRATRLLALGLAIPMALPACGQREPATLEAPNEDIVPEDVAAAETAAMLPYDLPTLRALMAEGSGHAAYLLGRILAGQGEPDAADTLLQK